MAKTGAVISSRLFAALGLIIFSAVIAGGASIFALNRFQASFNSISRTELPTLTDAAQISRISASIAERGAMLVVAPNNWVRITEISKVHDDAVWLEEILNNISTDVLKQEKKRKLLELKQQLTESYDTLNLLVNDRIKYSNILSQINDEIHLLQEDLVAIQFAANLPSGSFVTSGPMQQWIELTNGILINMSAATDAKHLSPLDRYENKINDLMSEVSNHHQYIPKEARLLGGEFLEKINSLQSGPDGLFAVKKIHLNNEEKIDAALKQIRTISERFLGSSKTVINDIRTAIADRGEKISGDLTLIKNLVLGLVLLSTLISVATFIYINKTVLNRLDKLRVSMLTHAGGENEPIDTSGNDELTEMAISLGYFVDAIHTREESLRHARDDAEQANIAKTKFLAAASHDLRQPLQALNLFVFALAGKEQDPEKKEIISLIRNSLDSLKELLNTLLDISKLEAGVVQPQVRDFRIASVIDKISTEMAPVAWKHNLEIKSVSSSANVHSDPLLIETILRNLLDNAIKYAGGGRVIIGCRLSGNKINVGVWDSGAGIADDQKDLIFNDFYQIDNEARQRSQGLGLGLSIVRRLAMLLGHELGFSSTVGKGTGFWISIPLAKESMEPLEDAITHDTINGNMENIAIIENDESVISGLVAVLSGSGYKTYVLNKLDEVSIKKDLRENVIPDLIIADYRLDSGVTGGNAITKIRDALGKEIPAIIITGDTDPQRLREAKKSGFDILHKPIKPEDLLASVRKKIAGSNKEKLRSA
ncbi:MAG: hybrid sensor histidine kinase/response regulator [Rhodospirillaceae bacterium]|nr:hybrid sensor histidine kinase/response regulator [Rhodospirillaceae bacterium]